MDSMALESWDALADKVQTPGVDTLGGGGQKTESNNDRIRREYYQATFQEYEIYSVEKNKEDMDADGLPTTVQLVSYFQVLKVHSATSRAKVIRTAESVADLSDVIICSLCAEFL